MRLLAIYRFLKGALSLVSFLEQLAAVPEVRAVLEGLAEGAVAAVPGLGIAAPLVPFALRAVEWAIAKPKGPLA